MATLIIGVYTIYLAFITAATIYVAHTLFSRGKIFMNTIFNGREELANATNKLFETGFSCLLSDWACGFCKPTERCIQHAKSLKYLV